MQYPKLIEAYQAARDTPSDIYEHVPCLRRLAEQSERIVEFGVRLGVSTTALLAGSIHGKLLGMTSYDINVPSNIKHLQSLAPGIWKFVTASSLEVEIPQTDLLLIDTKHTQEQLYRELSLYHYKVDHRIVIHDTELFKYDGEGKNQKGKGLASAINQFLSENTEWFVSEHHPFNNGLTVISRLTSDKPSVVIAL